MILIGLIMFLPNAFSEVLELEESEFRGKKDQPETTTFISRSQLDEIIFITKFDALEKIEKELKREIFSLKND